MSIASRTAAVLAAVLSAVALVPAPPAAANVFCPVTVAAVVPLAILGRADTYGILLQLDPGDTASVRLRLDSAATSYAVDFADLGEAGNSPLRQRRYVALPPGERLVAAWVESTGTSSTVRTECPLTSPYAADAPGPTDPRALRARQADQAELRDSFSSRTPVARPQRFGPAAPRGCTQPYAPPRAVLPVPAEAPPEARAVKATGTAIVRVDLDESSTVVGGAVVRSSGFAPLDRAALAAALKSSYRTETFGCRSIASSYQFAVTFGGG